MVGGADGGGEGPHAAGGLTLFNAAPVVRSRATLREDTVFDRVWQITYDDQGNATFRDRPQRLLPGDSEK